MIFANTHAKAYITNMHELFHIIHKLERAKGGERILLARATSSTKMDLRPNLPYRPTTNLS